MLDDTQNTDTEFFALDKYLIDLVSQTHTER